MRYIYLIAFAYDDGYGSLIFSNPRKINNKQTFEEVQQTIRETTSRDSLAILSFQLIGKEKTK